MRTQPGCDFVYRRYGNVTVSSSSLQRYLESHLKILEKYEVRLSKEDTLSNGYKDALAQSYFKIARKYLLFAPARYPQLLEKTIHLSPNFQAQGSERTFLYRFIQKIIGFRKLELLVVNIKHLTRKIKRLAFN